MNTKKSIIISSAFIFVLSLMAFGYINMTHAQKKQDNASRTNSDDLPLDYLSEINKQPFFFGIGTRFSGIAKSDLDRITSINDFFTDDHIENIISYKTIKVTILEDNQQTEVSEIGYHKTLTEAQIKLLRSMPLSTNFLIRADYIEKNKETGFIESSYATPHLTLVPEKQAIYSDGNDAITDFLRENSAALIAHLSQRDVQPAKLYFTVTENGLISKVRLVGTSGHSNIDKHIQALLAKLPGKWTPAVDINGEKVAQELVVSFGSMGC